MSEPHEIAPRFELEDENYPHHQEGEEVTRAPSSAGRAGQTLHLRHNNQLRRLHKTLGSMKISENSEAF